MPDAMTMKDLKSLIREIPDYPKPGILFYDLTTLLQDKQGFHSLIEKLCARYAGSPVDVVAGIEARGFIFAPALAYALGAGFVPVRKPNKLALENRTRYLSTGVWNRFTRIAPGRHKTWPARHRLRRSSGDRRHRCRYHQTRARTRRRSGRRRLRRGTHVPPRPRKAPRHRRFFTDSVRQVISQLSRECFLGGRSFSSDIKLH